MTTIIQKIQGEYMSLALARKYRPSTFDDLVGQDTVSQTLSLALDGDRLSHAYLFSGLRGSGKTSTARIFAKALLCDVGASSHPCDECDQCKMANESRHIDIIEMDAASNRGIDDIKDIIEHTKYKPGIGRYKIFIIDEVHMLTPQAFNALLKTLEEPPSFVKFILATTDPLKLPATILSRTQHFRFKKIPQKLVLGHLEHILDLENIGYEREALDVLARSGAGSLRDSLTLLDQAIVYSKNFVDMVTVTNMLGIIEPSLLDTLLDNVLKKDEKEILDFIRLSSEYETEMIVDELSLYLKERLFARDSRFSPLIIDRFFRILAESKEMLALGSDGEFVLSLGLFKMMESLSIYDIDGMIRTLQKELSGVEATPVLYATSTERPPKVEMPTAKPAISQTGLAGDEQIEKEQAKKAVSTEESILEPENKTDESSQSIQKSKEIQQDISIEHNYEPRAEQSISATSSEEIEPTKTIHTAVDDVGALRFKTLLEKIYDRDFDLGSSFEKNVVYESYVNDELVWISSAKGDDKKILINNWSIIKMFVQEIFSFETKIKPKKKVNTKTIEPKTEEKINKSEPIAKDNDYQAEMKSSCVAPEAGDTEAAKEKDPSEILKEPMIKEIIKLFDPKRVRIQKNA